VSLDKAASRMRDLAGPRLVERARLLAALMRIADPVSVAMAGILPRTPLLVRDGRIVLELPADKAPLASERLLNRMRQLGKLMSLGAQIEVMSPMPTSAPAPAYE
jgi:exopolyphosphatase/guanosine-5'-triphosphate,3'-diphosphate pyrophosphatase